MTDPDFNLLVALDILLAEASVAGAARRLNLSTSAMSRTLSRLREVTGDPILVRAGRQMVLTPWAEATRDRARHALHEARAVLQPSTDTFRAENLERVFTVRANDGFVVAFGPLLIAVDLRKQRRMSASALPQNRRKRRVICGRGWLTWKLVCRATWGPKFVCSGSLRTAL